MADSPITSAAVEGLEEAPASNPEPTTLQSLLVEEDLVVEEVSIDGMCGVY